MWGGVLIRPKLLFAIGAVAIIALVSAGFAVDRAAYKRGSAQAWLDYSAELAEAQEEAERVGGELDAAERYLNDKTAELNARIVAEEQDNIKNQRQLLEELELVKNKLSNVSYTEKECYDEEGNSQGNTVVTRINWGTVGELFNKYGNRESFSSSGAADVTNFGDGTL